jgi:tryptophan synthase alpha chain
MPNRIIHKIQELESRGGNSLSVVLMLGDPDFDTTLKQVQIATEEGVDLVELGIPITDPFLDSPTMRESMQRALAYCDDLARYLEILGEVRRYHPALPIEVMIYRSTLERIGLNSYARALQQAQMDATLVADAARQPQWFRRQLDEALLPCDIVPIRFVPEPYSTDLLEDIRQNARGFVVAQTVPYPDGRREALLDANAQKLSNLRSSGIDLPLILAYGISTPDDVRKAIAIGADGILIGTAVLEAAYRSHDELRALLTAYRRAAGT